MKDETVELFALLSIAFFIGCFFSEKILSTNPAIIVSAVAMIITGIFSFFTLKISKGQKDIARTKLDLDLFDKKFSIYDAIITLYLFGRAYFHTYVEDDTHPKADFKEKELIMIQNFRRKYIEYSLFFDNDDFINELKEYVDKWQNYIFDDFALSSEIEPTKRFFIECTPKWEEFTKRMAQRIKVNYPNV